MRRVVVNSNPSLVARFFSGGTQYASILHAEQVGLNPELANFSMSMWFKTTSTGTLRSLIGKGGTADATPGYWIYVNETSLQGRLGDGSGVRFTLNSGAVLTTQQWHHFAWSVTRASNALLYVDGVLRQTMDISSQPGTLNTTQNFSIGASGSGAFPYNGRIDAVGFWNGRALTADAVAELYKNGAGVAYRDLDAGLRVNLTSWWDMDGTFVDAHGSNHLTNNNGATFLTEKR